MGVSITGVVSRTIRNNIWHKCVSGTGLTSWIDVGVLMSHIVGTLGGMSVLIKLLTVYSVKESVGGEKIADHPDNGGPERKEKKK